MNKENKSIGALCRGCRGILNWPQDELAKRSKVSRATIARLESGMLNPKVSTSRKIIRAFQDAGVVVTYDKPRGGFTLVVNKSGEKT
ncbi:MAG: hypothetical protein ACD_84C00038G0010 [uncultured bacterium]|nr:MAG: hypothetical protein ACD_84C00038G0010 [uncultured bacterium]